VRETSEPPSDPIFTAECMHSRYASRSGRRHDENFVAKGCRFPQDDVYSPHETDGRSLLSSPRAMQRTCIGPARLLRLEVLEKDRTRSSAA